MIQNIIQNQKSLLKKSVGNFVEFLQFRVRGGNIYFKNNLENSTKNATYVSKESIYLKMILLNI